MVSFSDVTQPMDIDHAGQEQSSAGYSLETESLYEQVGCRYPPFTCSYDGSPYNCKSKKRYMSNYWERPTMIFNNYSSSPNGLWVNSP